MDRASFIKSLLVVAAAPKIIGELGVDKSIKCRILSTEGTFPGIIPYITNIDKYQKPVEILPFSEFRLSDFERWTKEQDRIRRDRPYEMINAF